MTRSYKHHSFVKPSCTSNKKSKTICHKLFRRISLMEIKRGNSPLYKMRKGYDIWTSTCDRRAYYTTDVRDKDMRK